MKGMSLIELLVVTALIMVLAGGGGVALNTFNDRQKVGVAKDELVASLRLARNAARTAKGPANGEIKYVKVTVSSEGVVLAVSDDATITYVNKDVTGGGVSLSQIPTGKDILFSPYGTKLAELGVGGSVVPVAVGTSFGILTSGVGTSVMVVIDSNGLIDGQ